MTDQIIRLNDAEEDETHLTTPVAPHQPMLSRDNLDIYDDDTQTIESSSATSTSSSSNALDYEKEDALEYTTANPRVIVLPIPGSSSPEFQSTVSLTEEHPARISVLLDNLPTEAATAGIAIGAESRFVETSSATLAREVKRLYDQHIGAKKGASVRSPFVITAFINQHGKQMYRVGRRDMDRAPLSTTNDIDVPAQSGNGGPGSGLGQSSTVHHTKRRSRVSVYSLLKTGTARETNRSPPSRRLVKTRSIPNMASAPHPDSAAPQSTLAHTTGRPHAHSVSSVDAFRPISLPPPVMDSTVASQDIFATVMSWSTVPPSPLSSGSGLRSTRSFSGTMEQPIESSGNDDPLDLIRYPFGRLIVFDSPIRPSPLHLSSPPVLREMQSFESGLTARAEPSPRTIRNVRARHSDDSISIAEESSTDDTVLSHPPQLAAEMLSETSIYSRFSTNLFDVLQNYKGLPVLDKVADIADPPTIKLSLQADGTPAPRDDPRFVIWGKLDGDEIDDKTASRSATDLASTPSVISRRKSTKRQSTSTMELPVIQTPASESPKRILVAATIERWIAQLTSQLNYDELLVFFLTYRTYVSGVDLGHLLICRFHWALGPSQSYQDEVVRRIVRARTFLAIRYWLYTFFGADFVPNRELRLLFANWLNALRRDPIITRHKDAPTIVQKLRKIAVDCKDMHTRGHSGSKRSGKGSNPIPPASVDFSQGDFAENLRKAVGKVDDDADIDLDLDDSQATTLEFGLNTNTSSSGKPTLDLAMMGQPLHLTYLQLGKQGSGITEAVQSQLPLPVPHSALSRVVVNAIGRLGRWKRVLNHRAMNTRAAPARPSIGLGTACIDASPFDVEASETGDLLLEKGGVEKYLKMLESQSGRKATPGSSLIHAFSVPPPLGLVPGISSTSLATTAISTAASSTSEPLAESSGEGAGNEGARTVSEPSRPLSTQSSLVSESIQFRHSVSDTSTSDKKRWDMDIVSIDDLDISDLSTDDLHAPSAPVGLRKMGRRLPNRRDFEFVRRSADSVSSMGIHTNPGHDSILSGGSSVTSSVSVGPDMAGPIHEWQMTALVNSLSDEDEPGDVDAALKRLEGQINSDKQKQKQSKVDAWVKSINRQRHGNGVGQFNTGLQRYSSDEEDYGEVQSSLHDGPASSSHVSSRSSISSAQSPISAAAPIEQLGPAVPPGLALSSTSDEAKSTYDAEPSAERLSRTSLPTANPPLPEQTSPLPSMPMAITADSGAFAKPEKSLKKHRSFVLSYKSETIVQHFSVIDRDLFLSLKFEELVSPEWMSSTQDSNILDWAQYVKERHEMKIERRGNVPSALTVIRHRFNLTVNFVISEIVLTHPTERVMIYSKFIRIAWKAYTLRNYHLLVAVLAGLDSHWVQRALKQTQTKKPGIWENRMLRDLRQWSTNQGHFKHIRHAVDALAEIRQQTTEPSQPGTDGQPATSRGRAASEGKPPPLPSCVPFFGIYLSELASFSSLPDLIDPTAPHEPVGMDMETGALDSPAHPEVFSYLAPLPPSVQLEPLINVHKQRLVAAVVKSFVAGQHLALRVDFPVERKVWQKCFKLRGLEHNTLQRVLALYYDRES